MTEQRRIIRIGGLELDAMAEERLQMFKEGAVVNGQSPLGDQDLLFLISLDTAVWLAHCMYSLPEGIPAIFSKN